MSIHEGIEMPEEMKICSCCGAECVRSFGRAGFYINADGKQMSKYTRGHSNRAMIYCGMCDFRLSQLQLGNRRAFDIYETTYTDEMIKGWNEEVYEEWNARRLRNQKARERYAMKKRFRPNTE